MAKITLLKDGPIILEGESVFMLKMDEEKYEHLERIALCRCGQSDNKPFCDGAHSSEEKGLPGGSIIAK
jgi:CDGSH-type Zn-finger protein